MLGFLNTSSSGAKIAIPSGATPTITELLNWMKDVKTDWPVLLITVFFLGLVPLFSLLFIRFARFLRNRRLRRDLVRQSAWIGRVRDFKPETIVAHFRAANHTTYLSTDKDSEIEDALREGRDLLITGRPGAGKSHSAIYHLAKVYPNWMLLWPRRAALTRLEGCSFLRRRYIVLLDDLNDYFQREGGDVLEFIENLRRQAIQVITVATMRTVCPEIDLVQDQEPKVLYRWMSVELPDWSKESWQRLSSRTGIDESAWDGTPLSAKHPSSEMRDRYLRADANSRRLLRSLHFMRGSGFKSVDRELLCQVFNSNIFHGAADHFETSLHKVNRTGWLREVGAEIEAYDPYLDQIEDWRPDHSHRVAFAQILHDRGRPQELKSFCIVCTREGDLEIAEKSIRRALELDPQSEACHYRLGRVLAKRGRLDDAELAFRAATEMKPRWATPWFQLVSVLTKAGKREEAREALTHAKQLRIGADPVARHLATMEIYMNNGDLEEALDECEFALQSEPTSFQTESVLYSRARILRELQRWSAALQTYEQLVLNNPGLAGAYFGMAEPLQMLGRSDEAIKNCRQALRLKPELEEARVTLAHLLTNEGYFKEAEEHIRLSLEIVMGKKQLARLWSYLGQVLDSGRVARNKEAEEAYRQALDLRPDYFEAHVGVAKALRHQGRLDESLNWNEKARLISPTDPTPLIGIAMCLMKQNRWPACLEAWRKYEQLGGRGKIAAYYSGIALEKIGDLSRARDEMNRARSLGYSSESVAASLARLDARA